MFEPEVYVSRRQKLVAEMRKRGIGEGSVLLSAHSDSPRNYRDNCYPFRQDSCWLYFIGLNEPEMLASIDLETGAAVLYGESKSLESEIWTGPSKSLGDLAMLSGIESSDSCGKAERYFTGIARSGKGIHFLPTCRPETVGRVCRTVGMSAEDYEKKSSLPLVESVIALREIKEEREIAELEKAVGVTEAMHLAVLGNLGPGWTEKDAAALALRVASERGCELGFSTIATTRGEVLHNQPGDVKCGNKGNFLLDAGAELPSGYSGDLTTTFPLGGQFSHRSADIYKLLERVFAASRTKVEPGVPFLEVHLAASLELARGMTDLGIMTGRPEDAVRAGAHALFFPHGLGHMIGLDVHDMEGLGEDRVGYAETERGSQFGLRSLRLAKPLKPGMVHSIEPGIYFIPALIEKWRREARHPEFIDYAEASKWIECRGMRIEEDWLVLPNGARRLGKGLDKSISFLEAARKAVRSSS